MQVRYRLFTLCGHSKMRAMFEAAQGALVLGMLIATLIALAFAMGGCATSMPNAPTTVSIDRSAYVPLHHNVPATFEGDPTGAIVWLCATQPREYVLPNGQHMQEEDHYLSYSVCPNVPIQ